MEPREGRDLGGGGGEIVRLHTEACPAPLSIQWTAESVRSLARNLDDSASEGAGGGTADPDERMPCGQAEVTRRRVDTPTDETYPGFRPFGSTRPTSPVTEFREIL